MQCLPKFKFVFAILFFFVVLLFNRESAFAGCNALGCATDGDCDGSGTVCGSDPASCARDCSKACTDPSDPTKTIPGTAVITGSSCNLCDYNVTCGTCDCGGGGGGGGSGGTNINGIVYATDTGKRWVDTALSCNSSYLGVSVELFDGSGNSLSTGSFNCNTEVVTDGGGHFDINGQIEASKSYSAVLSLPSSTGYSCTYAAWEIWDRKDLGNPSDDVVVNNGLGCTANFTSDTGVYDWKYGIIFYLNPQVIDNDPPTDPGDPVIDACIPIGGGVKSITFTGSTDSGSGLSHYVVNVDEDNNNQSNFASVCSTSNNYGDVCANTNATSINYNFNDSKIYRVWIDAFDNDGNKSSSNVAIYSPRTLPPAPTNVSATDGLVSKINISWVDNSNQSYNSETSFDIIKDGNVIASVLPNITLYVDSGDICDGSNHSYNVSAINSCGTSYSSTPNSGNCILLYENKWWQAFNGGVHSNGGLLIDDIPSTDYLIGDPLAIDHPIFVGRSIADFNSYGLVSSFNGQVNISSGSAGISGQSYYTGEMNGQMDNLANPDFFAEIMSDGSSWVQENSQQSLSSIGSSDNASYFFVYGSSTINSNISYNDNKAVAVIFASTHSTLTLRKDIIDTSLNSDKSLIIFVDGNVVIDPGVSRIEAVIYASGSITVESAGENSDDVLYVRGGLYGSSIAFNRDLTNSPVNNNKPAEIISYNHNLMVNQGFIPFEVKEASIIWVQE